MKRYRLDLKQIWGVCECGCVSMKNENYVYKPNQIENYQEIIKHNDYMKFWCCNGCQNNFYKEGVEKHYLDCNIYN